MLLMIVESK